ncbi:MAG TPA: glycoside hydrolase family 20 zincin-like fold domain-containing protein, partial [Candidatus Sulfotelmatobacter sp.]|nr:glycoside hydrolase family 20 zincin-like fold domain-containing protein [Candidatus Sulfotelmatobacter sp.]
MTLTAASHPDVRTGAASGLGPEGYRLTAGDARVVIESGGPAGAFYARATLAQLCRLHESAGAIPGLFIEDRPDLAYRGVMLDVSRDRVPTIATLHRLVDELSSWKVNVLQLYTEHTFAYPGHADVWKDASPLTAVEIQDLDAYCRERFVELVPNQNS